MTLRSAFSVTLMCVALVSGAPVLEAHQKAQPASQRTFATPEEAVRALTAAASATTGDDLRAIFGAAGQELFDSSDLPTARRNREVFTVAIAEGWRLQNVSATRKTLIVGNEDWPFPVPLVRRSARWSFDAAAGREEVLDRRIG